MDRQAANGTALEARFSRERNGQAGSERSVYGDDWIGEERTGASLRQGGSLIPRLSLSDHRLH